MILYAKQFVEEKILEFRKRVSRLYRPPSLAIIQVEGNPASDKYVSNKLKRCAEVGVEAELYLFGISTSTQTIANKIKMLNADDGVDGILLQLPLPTHLDEAYLTNLIDPKKDVDGFTTHNTGALSLNVDGNIPCTPKGVIDLLKFYKIPIASKDVLIINRSNIVGKPLAQLMLRENATVTIAHSGTKNLKEKIKAADIVVTGVGIPDFLYDEDFSDDTIIIDISINFKNGKMCGDVHKEDYEDLATRCHITPVPGGIGLTTVMSLIDNLILIRENIN
jgi:methylenetetrahydrofolate dehydrogenase (NADP+)/methenyltetrahydrofolate cyclohydrolase